MKNLFWWMSLYYCSQLSFLGSSCSAPCKTRKQTDGKVPLNKEHGIYVLNTTEFEERKKMKKLSSEVAAFRLM